LIVCERTFTREDPHDPTYSMQEYDLYAWIPVASRNGVDTHRLSIRKNHQTDEFELYRQYFDYTGARTKLEVLFKDEDFAKVIDRGNAERRKFLTVDEDLTVCTHEPSNKHIRCNGRRS